MNCHGHTPDEWRAIRRERERKYRKLHAEKFRAKYRRAYWRNRPKIKIRAKRYRETHRDKVLADKKEWQRRNWSHRQEYMRRYYAKHSDHIKSASRGNYRNNRSLHIRRQAAYVRALPPDVKEARRLARNRVSAAYRRAHLAEYAAHTARRRAIKKAVAVAPEMIKEWMVQIRKQPTAICYYCRSTVSTRAVHFDHVTPIKRGGAHSISNLAVACAECNLSKNATPVQQFVVNNQHFLAI